MTENRRLKIFLCHSKDDKSKIRKLYNRLIADNFDVWLDEVKLMPGQDWDLEIKKAVRNSDTVIVCLSNSSTTKEGYIQKEIRFALDVADEKPEGTIFLIPARLENCNVPDRISRYQWVDLFERSGYLKLIESLHLRADDLSIRYDSSDLLPKTTKGGINIPILGSIFVGEPFPELKLNIKFDYFENNQIVEVAQELFPAREKGNDLFALESRSGSLIDAMINDGDIVILKPATKVRNGEMAAIWLPKRSESMLKFFFEENDQYRLQPADPTVKPIYIKKSEPLEIKGKVVMVIRKVERGLQ
ncbi:MAG: TIR domain-containing protein [Chloroflexi bacterium]|nr:TIR domain-containing protein [Chloroflexota bacterium]